MATEVLPSIDLRFLAESLRQTDKGSVTGRGHAPKGNLDGFLARLHRSRKSEGTATPARFALPRPSMSSSWASTIG
jgi:hypothetical protein